MEPAAAGDSGCAMTFIQNHPAAARSAGFGSFLMAILGLTPQALR